MSPDQEIQIILNKMFKLGLYPQTESVLSSTNYMSVALKTAYLKGLITKEEGEAAVNSINKYVGTGSTLFIFLSENEYPATLLDQIVIYKNWLSKPIPRK